MKVGRSNRIKQYEGKLTCIDAWSTLYELTKLDENQFEKFAAQYLSGDKPRNFMRADVERFKSGTCAKREPFSLLAAIEVDVTGLNEPEDMLAIEEELEGLEQRLSRFPAARVRRTDLAAKLELKIEAEATKAAKDEINRAVKAARKRRREVVAEEIAKKIGPNKKAKFLKHWGLEWDEIFRSDINANNMLDYFGHERVEPHVVDSEFDNHWAYAESGTCATSPEEDAELAELLAEFKEEIARESTDPSVKGHKPQ
jgi:hypothetical protein